MESNLNAAQAEEARLEREAADRDATEQRARDDRRADDERAALDRKADDRKAADDEAAERKADDVQRAADRRADFARDTADRKADDQRAADRKASDRKDADRKDEDRKADQRAAAGGDVRYEAAEPPQSARRLPLPGEDPDEEEDSFTYPLGDEGLVLGKPPAASQSKEVLEEHQRTADAALEIAAEDPMWIKNMRQRNANIAEQNRAAGFARPSRKDSEDAEEEAKILREKVEQKPVIREQEEEILGMRM